MKKLVLGILAHVDAGKTTLSEAMLYTCGSIRKLGRVDHKNTSLDSHELERARGITIFSKQAQLKTDKVELCLLDTPGHVDFSAETERTLQVLDYAVLVISGTDGVQAHTETLWRLLRKHTEGGDFREAACRAVRQGLMKAESVLLEPWYEFTLEVPPEQIGRAISDIRAMSGEFETESSSVIHGLAPVSELNGYAAELASYTSGRGRLTTMPAGYRPCHNTQTVLDGIDYDPEADLENTPDSVFCSHGAGVAVKWDKVAEHMHIDTGYGREKTSEPVYRPRNFSLDDKELEAIMEREFGPIRRREYTRPVSAATQNVVIEPTKREYLIVDGYNLLFAWDELNELAKDDLDLARTRLIDILKSYRGFKDCELVLVFDGYKVEGNPGEKETEGIHIAYTKQNETADMYIEKLANDIGKNYAVRVITNDSLIRLSALRSGVLRMSSGEFINELKFAKQQIAEYLDGKR